MTVLEKIKRCVSLVWDFQEIYGEEDIEDFCSNELLTYSQHDEILEYFKRIENLEKENAELEKSCDETQELLDKQIEVTYKLDKENAELKKQVRGYLINFADNNLVKVLRDCIIQNKKLSSQEQNQLSAWVECAMDFGSNLDECAKELEEANKANEWHYVKDGDLPKEGDVYLVYTTKGVLLGHYEQGGADGETSFTGEPYSDFTEYPSEMLFTEDEVIAWKEIVLPELKESE